MTELANFIKKLPAPLGQDVYELYRHGIWEHDDVDVYINEQQDFAFLYPSPTLNYENYEPRVKKLELGKYRKNNADIVRRFNKTKSYFKNIDSFLEIGCGDGSFLFEVNNFNKKIEISCIEKDKNTKDERDKYDWLMQYEEFKHVNSKIDLIGFFHVFEHIKQPSEFLLECRNILSDKGILLIEVPSLDDPLLNLYNCDSYSNFYFQSQHPYIYSLKSLERVLESEGFKIIESIPFQRYSLENHLNWLVNCGPGGNIQYQKIFNNIDEGYRHAMENTGKTDSIIIAAKII